MDVTSSTGGGCWCWGDSSGQGVWRVPQTVALFPFALNDLNIQYPGRAGRQQLHEYRGFCTSPANYSSFPPGPWPWLRCPLLWLAPVSLFRSVRAISAAEGQCQHCQGQWKCIWGTKGDGAYARGQNKSNCTEWISFPLLLLLVKGLLLEMSHFVSFLNNAFSVVVGVFCLCWL